MADLRNDEDKLTFVRDTLKNVLSELMDTEAKAAVDLAKWLKYETILYKKHLRENFLTACINELKRKSDPESINNLEYLKAQRKRNHPPNYPNNIVKGNVVCVNYGVGIGDELSERHYGVILHRRGRTFLVAPLTSTEQHDGDNNINLKGIGLPNENANGSYIIFSQIRYVHYRRIEKIIGVEDGKLHVCPLIADMIIDYFTKLAKVWK